MKKLFSSLLGLCLMLSIIYSCNPSKAPLSNNTYIYKVDDPKLSDTIIKLDSIFFNYYNTCKENLPAYGEFFLDSIEFYHDKGGLMTNKQGIIESTNKYVCGKVRRELVPGSIEVYPVPGYGAIEIGLHKSHNSEEPNAAAHAGRFTIIWKQTEKGWKISRVISLH